MEDKIKKLGILVRRAAARWIRERRTDSTVQEAQPQSDVTNRETAKMEKESPTARPVSGEPQGVANPTCPTSPDEGISAQKDKEIFYRYQETISKNRETNLKERETRTEAGSSFPLRPPLTIQAFQTICQTHSQTDIKHHNLKMHLYPRVQTETQQAKGMACNSPLDKNNTTEMFSETYPSRIMVKSK